MKRRIETKEIMVPKKFLIVTSEKHQEQSFEITKIPEDGKCILVRLETIQRNMFIEERSDKKEEKLRRLINKAIKEAEKEPEKYEEFYILVPKREWVYKAEFSDVELEEYPAKVCGTMSNWVEIALYLAQRLSNGESWEKLCHKLDTLAYYRIFTGEKGTKTFLGGGKNLGFNSSAPADINWEDIDSIFRSDHSVPSVTIRENIY